MADFLKDTTKHDLHYIQDLADELTNYLSTAIISIYDGVTRNIGQKPQPLPKDLKKGFFSRFKKLGLKLKGIVGRSIQQKPTEPFVVKGLNLYKKGKPLTNQQWENFNNQILDYLRPFIDGVSEEIAVKGVLLSMASNEAERQGKTLDEYGKKSYKQVENEYFSGAVPDTINSANSRFNLSPDVKKSTALSYNRVADYVTNVNDELRTSIKQQVIAAHRRGDSPAQLASDLYWQKVDKPELKKYTAEINARSWMRVAHTELAMVHEEGKLAQYENQAKESIDDSNKAVYFVFNGSGICKFCAKHQGTIVRLIPVDQVTGGTDSLSVMGIKDKITDVAIWNGKSNVGRSQKNWWVATPTHPWPFSDDTEVLTSNGWKLFKDVKQDDLIFSMNKETSIVEYVKWIKKHIRDYKGRMVHFSAQSCDQLVTPEHSMLVERRIRTKGKPQRDVREVLCADHIREYKEFYIPRTGKWYDNKVTEKEIIIAKLWGWYISEGCVIHKHENSYYCQISQDIIKNEIKYNEIKSILDYLGIKYCEMKKGLGFYGKYAKHFYDECHEVSSKKFVPEWLKQKPVICLKAFLETFCKGDGYTRISNCFGYPTKEVIYYTSSKQLVSDTCELIIKCGKVAYVTIVTPKGTIKEFKNGTYTINNDVYMIREGNSNRSLFCPQNKSEIKDVAYSGKVYCLTLKKNNTLLVKRNGKISWSGNCADTFSRIDPENQKWSDKEKRIVYKHGQEFEEYMPKWFLKENDTLLAKRKQQEDLAAKKREEDYYKTSEQIIREQAEKKKRREQRQAAAEKEWLALPESERK